MSQGGQTQKVITVGVFIAIILSITALIVGSKFPTITSGDIASSLTYDAVAPYVKDYLISQNIVNSDGAVNVPNTSSEGSTAGLDSKTGSDSTTSTALTVEEAIQQLVDTGKLEYLKGDKGNTGAAGATGATGATGTNGTNGANGKDGQNGTDIASGSGIVYSGGVISIKPCAVDQILSYNGTTWDCATITSNGVAANTTNTSAALSLDGEMLSASITDSEGRTISSNQVNLGDHFISSDELSNYATTSNLGLLSARVTNLENADYASKSWVESQNYLTSSGLASYLVSHDYVTDDALSTILSSYLLKNEFAATLNTHLLAGKGVEIAEDSNGNSVISSLQNAAIFEMVHNYLSVQNPDSNKIYVDLDGSPMKEYIYLNGAGGVTTDPSDPAAWSQVGSVTIDLSPYSTTDQMNTAINNALTNQLNDLANNSNLSSILTDYVKTGDMTSAISSATTDMATKTWVNAQGFLTQSSLVGNATESWVNSQNFAKIADLDAFYTTDEIDTMMSQKADQSALDDTNVRVSALEATMSSKQDKLTAGQNITISGSVISANVDLSDYALKSYVDSQDFVTNASALATYATQSFVTSQGYLKKADIDGYATQDWVAAQSYLTATDLTSYAKESWVTSQNYLVETDLISYLQTNDYTTAAQVNDLIAAAGSEYVAHQEFAEALHNNLKAGDGITISADNTISASMFVMTTNRLTVTNPDPGKIYVETGTDSSSPVAQYIYVGGQNGAPADPTQPDAWLKVGDLSGVDLSAYSTTDQMNSAITTAIDNEVQYLNTIYASESWVDSQGYLKKADLSTYATQSWVSQNYLASSALNGYATQSWVTAQNYLTNSALNGYATESFVTSQGYITSAALVGNATQSWVKAQNYLTTDSASATYVTQSSLSTTLAAYQPLITGGASTITTANLTPNMMLQSNADGKVVASGVSLTALQTALSDIASLKTQLANTQTAISSMQTGLGSLGNYGEIATGQTFRGKPVYRQDFYIGFSANANVEVSFQLLAAGVVDTILNVGGMARSGYGTESWGIPSASAGQYNQYHYVRLNDGGALMYISMSSSARSSAPTFIIVEYTKK